MSNDSLIRKSLEDELHHLLKIGAIDCIKINIEQIVNRLMTRIEPSEISLRSFVESITNAVGPYTDLNGHRIVADAYRALRSEPEPVSVDHIVKTLVDAYGDGSEITSIQAMGDLKTWIKTILDAAGVKYAE